MDEVVLVEYNPLWSQEFDLESHFLLDLLPLQHVKEVFHIGSTAVRGLISKPVIDILIITDSVEEFKTQVPTLQSYGYGFWDENPDSNHLFFVKWIEFLKSRSHHLHVKTWNHVDPRFTGTEYASNSAKAQIVFRDALRQSKSLRDEYAALKTEIALKLGKDRDAYTISKSEFILGVLKNSQS